MGRDSCYSKVADAFTTRNKLAKILFAEFLGTFVLIVLGDGSVAQNVVSGGASGAFLTINIAWGLAVAMGVWVSGGVSGGHINPAMTFAFCIMGKCPWSYFPIYWIGQYLGAIAGAAVVFGAYYEAIEDFDGGIRITDPAFINNATGVATGTAGIFSTYPKPYLSEWGGFGDQIVGTAMLALCVLAITDENNQKPHKGMVPFAVGLVVMVIGMSFGHNCGYAINPARDWGPRIFTLMAGWGTEPFSYRDYNWFWVPFAGPHVGAIVGGWLYLLFVGNHIRPEEEPEVVQQIIKPDYERDPRTEDWRHLPRYHPDGPPFREVPVGNGDLEMKAHPNKAFIDDYTSPGDSLTGDRPSPTPQHPGVRRSTYPYYMPDKTVL